MNKQTKHSVYSYTEIKNALLHVHNISREKRQKNDEFYRLDRKNAWYYLEGFPKWRKKISLYLSSLRQRKKPIIFVDICGRASGNSFGVDKNYSFSLQPVSIFCLNEK